VENLTITKIEDQWLIDALGEEQYFVLAKVQRRLVNSV